MKARRHLLLHRRIVFAQCGIRYCVCAVLSGTFGDRFTVTGDHPRCSRAYMFQGKTGSRGHNRVKQGQNNFKRYRRQSSGVTHTSPPLYRVVGALAVAPWAARWRGGAFLPAATRSGAPRSGATKAAPPPGANRRETNEVPWSLPGTLLLRPRPGTLVMPELRMTGQGFQYMNFTNSPRTSRLTV